MVCGVRCLVYVVTVWRVATSVFIFRHESSDETSDS
jgi:hypothetical protein